jgi:hypothetical protein
MVQDSEVIVIWAMDDWDTWAEYEIACETDPRVAAWRARTGGIAIDWRNKLMVPTPGAPLERGRLLGPEDYDELARIAGIPERPRS